MNSIQIFEILSKDKFSKKYFYSVISIDELPLSKRKLKTTAYIINTDKRSGKGEHWLSIFYDQKSNCQFFDSLGFGPEIYGMENFLLSTSKSIQINKYPIQSVFSELCGYYSILFILTRSRGISFNNFLKYFDSDTFNNDLKINNLIKTFY
jgi:hypothetical protein